MCRLNKALYGLKQAPRCWNHRFKEFLSKFEFKECQADKCVFVGFYKDIPIYLGLFFDDGVLLSRSKEAIRFILSVLRDEFEITVGNASYFAGLEISRDRKAKQIYVSQSVYTKRLIEKYGMSNTKSVSVPADPNVILYPVENEDECLMNISYREAVGSLMYLAVISRTDIALAVNTVSKFFNRPNQSHWRAVKRIFSYLIGTVNVGNSKCSYKAFTQR